MYLIMLPYRKLMSHFLVYGLICLGFMVSNVYASDTKRIAVLELKNRTQSGVSQTELAYLTSEIRLIMSYLPKDQFLVMTKESMMMLIEPGKTLEDCVGECEVETGRLINADWIITGEILRFGSSLRVSLRLHNTVNGQFVKGESIRGLTIESLENPLHLAALRFVYQISPTLKQRAIRQWGTDLKNHLTPLRNDTLAHPHSSTKQSNQPQSQFQDPSIQKGSKTMKGRFILAGLSSNDFVHYQRSGLEYPLWAKEFNRKESTSLEISKWIVTAGGLFYLGWFISEFKSEGVDNSFFEKPGMGAPLFLLTGGAIALWFVDLSNIGNAPVPLP